MKQNVITVALFAVLATMAVGCQKENLVEPQSAIAEIGTVRTVSYAVDGVAHRVTLYGDAEWKAFLSQIMALADEGHDVKIVDEGAASRAIATKDTQTFSTTSSDAAAAWVEEKLDDGYQVSVSKDKTTGLYTCTAIR